MTKYSINLLQVPNQKVSANLKTADGSVRYADITVRLFEDGKLYADIDIDGENQCRAVRAVDRMPLLMNDILGGNLYFMDTLGNNDPEYKDFNSRYILVHDTDFYFRK